MDNLSVVHFKAVRNEIEGRFFDRDEAEQLKAEIDRRTITNASIRAAAAETWKPTAPTDPEPTIEAADPFLGETSQAAIMLYRQMKKMGAATLRWGVKGDKQRFSVRAQLTDTRQEPAPDPGAANDPSVTDEARYSGSQEE